MGRVFLIERDGPVFRCSACNTEIAQSYFLLDDWLLHLGLHEFADAYNVMTGKVMVSYGNDLYNGYEVKCVNCCALLGWIESDEKLQEEADTDSNSEEEPVYPLFRFMHARVVPPPANPPPPPPNPLQLQNVMHGRVTPPPANPPPPPNPPQLQNVMHAHVIPSPANPPPQLQNPLPPEENTLIRTTSF